MAANLQLTERVRKYLTSLTKLKVEEKKMFGGVAFLVNGKMCINVNGENLMCRFDPALTGDVKVRSGYLPMIMKGKELDGYCYVEPAGFSDPEDFKFWADLCLDYNAKARSSKKK